MALGGTRKAALLLMSLDPTTAGELLKFAGSDTAAKIAAELAYLGTLKGADAPQASASVKEFFSLLDTGPSNAGGGGDGFIQQMLESAMGKGKSQEVLGKVQQLLAERDPFAGMRGAATASIAKALAGESAQVAALVLSQLPPKKSSELLGLLEEDVRAESIGVMASGEPVSVGTSVRVANVVSTRLAELAAEGGVEQATGDDLKDQQHRRVAVLLRGLKKELRDSLTSALSEKDKETGDAILRLMVVWEDMPLIADRDLQELLRQVDSRALALAMVGADEGIVGKVRDNISERAASMLDEETSLMSSPKEEEIEAAREEILTGLRELNVNGDLTFEEPS